MKNSKSCPEQCRRVKITGLQGSRVISRLLVLLATVVSKTNIKRVLAILHMKRIAKIGDFITKAKLIRKSMSGNPFFPSPPISVAVNGAFDNDIKTLDTAEVAASARTKGAAQARDAAKQVVLNDMHALQGYVQTVADFNPAKAEEIIESAGFDVKIASPHSKDDFIATNTKVSGTVKLAVNVKKATEGTRRGFFKWQYSTDNMNWTEAPSTLRGSTNISKLTALTTYYFRYLVVLKGGESSWSTSVSLIVM